MSTFFVDPAMAVALWITVKASVLLGVAAIVQALLYRRTSAATRHLLWTLAIAGVLLLPMLSLALPSLALPRWAVMIRTAPPKAADAGLAVADADAGRVDRVEVSQDLASASAPLVSSAESAAGARAPVSISWSRVISWSSVIASVYAGGVLLMLMQLAMQRRSVRRLARGSTEVQDPQWQRLLSDCARSMGVHRPVRLLRSCECSMPMAFGTRRPAILIPAMADTWPDDRARAVVLHELAHVARYDCLTQTLAHAACAMYWFHPAAWWVARRLRIERELACDDRVIAAGTDAREYAGHLLEIAFTFGSYRAPALAVTMARPRQLEGRMRAVLDATRNRSTPAVRVRVAAVVMAAALLLPLAAAHAVAVTPDSNANRTPATEAAMPAPAPTPASTPQQEPKVLPQHLKAIEWPLMESARRIVDEVAAAITVPQDKLPGLPGTWEIRPSNTEGTVQLRLVEMNSSSGSDIRIERLEGLTAAQLTGAGGPVQFRMRRDAGTFSFEGVMHNGVGAGTFSFTADPNFPAELAKRGFGRPTSLEQYQMARHDVGYEFLDELTKQGYAKPEVSELVRAGQHGVHATYMRDMGALGYRLGTLEPLITLRDHGVTPAYVRELGDQGYKGLSADDLRKARDHGVTPEYVRAMRDAGYSSLTMVQLIEARDHGVSAQFVRELGEAGHRKLPLDELIRVRDHGVSPEYVREVRQLGYELPIDELVRARDHGIDVEFVRGVAALGYGSVPMESLIRLRDHGVTPKYAQELKALGYDHLTVEDLVTLRDHGLTPDRIRTANARAGTRLPVDMLKSFAAGGMR
jgi:beta-lactamase regulating signal transducer with metallopeptidase domain